MCIAIALPANKAIKKDTLKNCFDNNKDGCGFAYIEKNKIKIKKGFFDFEEFYKAFSDIKLSRKSNMILHFRWATHGKIDTNNCQPFRISKDVVFCHNGIIDISIPNHKKDCSDTSYYNSIILKKLPNEFYKNVGIMNAITLGIDPSKFVFMNRKGNIYIINEDAGIYVDGVWFSNTSYKETYLNQFGYNYNNRDSINYDPEGIYYCDYCNERLITESEKYTGICGSCLEYDNTELQQSLKQYNKHYTMVDD